MSRRNPTPAPNIPNGVPTMGLLLLYELRSSIPARGTRAVPPHTEHTCCCPSHDQSLKQRYLPHPRPAPVPAPTFPLNATSPTPLSSPCKLAYFQGPAIQMSRKTRRRRRSRKTRRRRRTRAPAAPPHARPILYLNPAEVWARHSHEEHHLFDPGGGMGGPGILYPTPAGDISSAGGGVPGRIAAPTGASQKKTER